MKEKFCFLIILFCFLSFCLSTANAQYVIQRVQLNGNAINAYFQNTGIFNQNTTSGNSPGFEWPKGSNKYAIFTTGLTIACYYNNSLRMASASYGGEYRTGYCINGVPNTNSNFRIYKVSRGDNQYNNPDWANWGFMVPYGAPFVDVNYNGTFEPAVDTPGVKNALQTIYMCLTDGFIDSHYPGEGFGGGTYPLFAELHMTAWCYSKLSLQDVQFIKWVIINKATTAWDSTIFSVVCDPDLGDANDDYIGCDTTRKLGFCYNADNNDPEYGAAPPAVGMILHKGAINKYVVPNKNVGLSSFDFFLNAGIQMCEQDPNGEPYPAYLYMSGFKKDSSSWLDPTQLIYPPNYYKKTKFTFPGDPETSTGWTEYKGANHNCDFGLDSSGTPVIPDPPGDKRYMLNSGKVKVNPGDTQTIIISQLIARGNDNKNSVTRLKTLADIVIAVYNGGFNIGIKNISTEIPKQYNLSQNYPNPFNPETKIKFDIADRFPIGAFGNDNVVLKVYDILGKEIVTLVNENLQPGTYEVTFDGSNLPSGIYFYRIHAGNFTESKKMVVIK